MIRIPELNLEGFALSNALPGETVPIAVHGWMISDEAGFYVFVRQLMSVLSNALSAQKIYLNERSITDLVVILHEDRSASMYCGHLGVIMEIAPKRDISVGEAIMQSDIADVRRVRFENVELKTKDRIILCTRMGWKFALYYDLRHTEALDIEGMEMRLAHLYRRIHFEAAYAVTEDLELQNRLMQDGWFPFAEIVGTEFPKLLHCYRDNFNITGEVSAIVAAFNAERVERIRARWASNPAFQSRMDILGPALDAFIASQYVASIKIIATEIEGILRDAHVLEKGRSAKTQALIDFARERGVAKSGSGQSLFLPDNFADYLRTFTFANFDPDDRSSGDLVSRHTVGHGAAKASVYSATAAVQYILTLDQLALYL